MSARTMRRILAALAALALVLPAAGVTAQEDELRRMAELRECIDRTDSARGQNAQWREAHCPSSIEEARARLGRLLEEQREKAARTAEKATKPAQEATNAASKGSGSDGGSTSSSTPAAVGEASTSGVAGLSAEAPPGIPFPPTRMGARPSSQGTPETCPVPPAPSFAAPPPPPIAGFGTPPPVNTDLIVWGAQQLETACQEPLGFLGAPLQLPTSSTQVQLQQEVPVLTIQKSAPLFVDAGSGFTYTITVENEGLGEAAAVRVRDELPFQFDHVASSTTQGTCQYVEVDHEVVCDLGPIPAGGAAQVTIDVFAPVDHCAQLIILDPEVENFADVYLVEEENEIFQATDRAGVRVRCSNIIVSKEATEASVEPGDEFEWVIEVEADSNPVNGLPVGPATGVNVIDDVDDRLQIMSVTTNYGNICTISPGNQVDCALDELETGEENILRIRIRVRALTAAGCEKIRNEAIGSAENEYAGHDFDNEDSAKVEVECAPNIVITKTATEPDVGGEIRYTITVRNTGTAEATGVVVNDDLDNDLTDVAPSASQGSCAVGAGNQVTCNLGTIATDAQATVTILATVPQAACPSIENRAAGFAANEPSGERGDNSASVTSEIGGCVRGSGTDGKLGLALTGGDILGLLAVAGLLLVLGAGAHGAGRRRSGTT